MNSIITTDDYFSQHTFANVEFTGVFERIRIRTVNNEAFLQYSSFHQIWRQSLYGEL